MRAQVTTIGARSTDVISQQELREACDLMAVALSAEKHARGYMQAIELRLSHGGLVEKGELMFDRSDRLVKRRAG